MIFRVALAIFKIMGKSILATSEFDEVFALLKTINDHVTDSTALMDVCGFGVDRCGSLVVD
jgi:hypothetical protein